VNLQARTTAFGGCKQYKIGRAVLCPVHQTQVLWFQLALSKDMKKCGHPFYQINQVDPPSVLQGIKSGAHEIRYFGRLLKTGPPPAQILGFPSLIPSPIGWIADHKVKAFGLDIRVDTMRTHISLLGGIHTLQTQPLSIAGGRTDHIGLDIQAQHCQILIHVFQTQTKADSTAAST
jgi:hypothetical protein